MNDEHGAPEKEEKMTTDALDADSDLVRFDIVATLIPHYVRRDPAKSRLGAVPDHDTPPLFALRFRADGVQWMAFGDGGLEVHYTEQEVSDIYAHFLAWSWAACPFDDDFKVKIASSSMPLTRFTYEEVRDILRATCDMARDPQARAVWQLKMVTP